MIDQFVPTKEIAHRLILLFKIGLGVAVLGILAQALETNMLYRDLQGADISLGEQNASDFRQKLILSVQALTFFGIFIFYLRWLYISYANLSILGVEGIKYNPRWVVGHYFIPLINLLWPFRSMQVLWNGSNPDYVNTTMNAREHSAPAIFIWWAIYLLTVILHLIVLLNSLGINDLSEQYRLSLIGFGGYFLHIIFILATIRLVRTVSWMQQQKYWMLQYPW